MKTEKSAPCPHCGHALTSSEIVKLHRSLADKTLKNCVECGKEFIGSKKNIFCSNACRCRSYRRNKEADDTIALKIVKK